MGVLFENYLCFVSCKLNKTQLFKQHFIFNHLKIVLIFKIAYFTNKYL